METKTEMNSKNPEIRDLSDVKRKMQFNGKVLKTSLAGALVDIGLDVPGVVHISQLSEEPVNRVEDVIQAGQTVTVWVKRTVPKKNRLELTMVKPLDLEWREIKKDMVIKGKIVRLEKFGAFVEIGAERPGLIHISEITHDYISKPSDVLKEGEEVEVQVLSVNRQKKQIKLSMKALEIPPAVEQEYDVVNNKKTDKEIDAQSDAQVPTAMEIALKEAMERKQETSEENAGNKKKTNVQSDEKLEQIFERTLQNRVQTSSK
ncbi:MAG: S1 RNA-binding domain-containing protein [Anaerolineales bacterium]|jgi:small subunit ribosomal protein S1